jgi:Xaa-Pro aminopeptidase
MVSASAVPEVPDSEIRRRIHGIQKLMAEHGTAALICFGANRDYAPADLWYLARWSCIDEETSYVFIPESGDTTLVTDAEWDLDRARQEACAGSVIFDAFPEGTLARLVRDHCEPGQVVGISGMETMPAGTFTRLTRDLSDVTFTDATALTTRQRMVKSALELRLMREASLVSDEGMAAGVRAMVAGATEHDVVAAAEHAIRERGAELSFTTVMGSGIRTALSTFLPTSKVISPGELVVLDCGARIAGYHGDMCRTIVVGRPGARQRRLLETTSEAIRAGIAAARPGGLVGDINEAAHRVVEDAGLGEYWWGFYMPHGAGAAQHEPPVGLGDGEVELEIGMVLCVEPGVAVPGEGGVILEQMIAITAEGPEVLNQLPLNLWDAQGI